MNQAIFSIIGKIFSHPYDWGGNHLIPDTLGFTPEPNTPYAEYWLGVHPKAPAQINQSDGSTLGLNDLIATDPKQYLGQEVADKYGNLPFLFKLLDAGQMLSIQVHPNKAQAEEGFNREELEGIAQSDPARTYKDTNHKPEFGIAQGEFWLLHGFKQKAELLQTLQSVEELQAFTTQFGDGDYKKLYEYVMKIMTQDEVNQSLGTLAQRVLPKYHAGELEKNSPDYWAAKGIEYMKMGETGYDRGVYSIYFLNLVHMQKGQGIFQDAGILHSYLEGPIIEVMANSDNVARGGITPKHIDVDELIKLVRFEGISPVIIPGEANGNETVYKAPIDEFVVSSIAFDAPSSLPATAFSGEILMGLAGNAKVVTPDKTLFVGKGDSIFISAQTSYEIVGDKGDVVYKTSIPQNSKI